jgi:hypothetical protein
VEGNSTGGQGSRRAVAPSDDDDELKGAAAVRTRKVTSILEHKFNCKASKSV